jgi:hypothetical protein
MPCPYPSIFTKNEWQKIMCENPYAINQPVISEEISASLCCACAECMKGKDVYLSMDDSAVSLQASRAFNDM